MMLCSVPVLIAVAVAILHYVEMKAMHAHVLELPAALGQVASLQTENGFYYAFYSDMVKANDTWSGLRGIMADDRSEYPDVVNALERFNVYQEVILGMVYRALRATGCTFGYSPWQFFRLNLYLVNSFGHAALALLSVEVSGQSICGLLAYVHLFLNRFQISRFGMYTSSNLREMWALPILWIQILCLWRLLSPPSRRRKMLWISFIASTFVFVVFWQFAPFLLLLQATALYFVYLVCGYESLRPILNSVLNVYLSVLAAALFIHFGSRYLLTSPFVSQVLALKLALLCPAPSSAKSVLGRTVRRLLYWREGVIAVLLFGLFQKLIAPIADADTHIFEILCTKVKVANDSMPAMLRLAEHRLPSCTTPSFNARLYLVMGVFNVLEADTVATYKLSTALYACGLTLVLGFLRVICARDGGTSPHNGRDAASENGSVESSKMPSGTQKDEVEGLRKRKGQKSDAEPERKKGKDGGKDGKKKMKDANQQKQVTANENTAALAQFLIQFLLFALLGSLINRLRAVFGPLLMVLAASCLGPGVWPLGPFRGKAYIRVVFISLHLCYLAFMLAKMPCLGEKMGFCDAFKDQQTNQGDTVDLIDWINRQLGSNTSIMCSMNTAGSLRAFTNAKMILHPQFESKNIRDRVQSAYELYHCGSDKSLAETMDSLHAEHVVFEISRCIFTPYMLDDKTKNCDQSRHKKSDLLCMKLHRGSSYFKLAFANGNFAVFRRLRKGEKGSSKRELKAKEIWAELSDACKAQGHPDCGGRLAEVASTWFHGLQDRQVAQTIFQHVLATFPNEGIVHFAIARYFDYDLSQSKRAEEHYKKAVQMLPNNPIAMRELLMYFDMVTKDMRSIKKLIGGREHDKGEKLGILKMGDADLLCEASVSAKQVGLPALGEAMWTKAKKLGPSSDCVRNNWPLQHADSPFNQTFTMWRQAYEVVLGAFGPGGPRLTLNSRHSTGARYVSQAADRWLLNP